MVGIGRVAVRSVIGVLGTPVFLPVCVFLFLSSDFLRGRGIFSKFSRVFEISLFPRFSFFCESRRQSPGWHTLEETLPSHGGLRHHESRLVRNDRFLPPLGIPSSSSTSITPRVRPALAEIPQGTQGLSQVTQSKVFSVLGTRRDRGLPEGFSVSRRRVHQRDEDPGRSVIR